MTSSFLTKILELFSPSSLTDEEKKVLSNYQKLSKKEGYEYSFASEDEVKQEEGLRELKNWFESEPSVELDEYYNVILTSFSDKEAGELTLNISKNSLNKFLDILEDFNLDYAIKKTEEGDNTFSTILFSKNLDKEVIEELEEIEDPHYYHMRAGKFFGYPDEDIKAFIRQIRDNEDLGGNLFPVKKSSKVLPFEKLLEEFGSSYDSLESNLVYFRVRNSEEGFEEAVSIARARKEDLEDLQDETGVDVI